ncbi:MAG: UvrD-helicase domain-containing protein, partial [Phycisphaerae bacterium]|nr:UvrD-helicase domain-containing protein [Phycisphaerae bacterium]
MPETRSEIEGQLLQDLTDAQAQAVTCTEGPVLVLAAAGSGKTRVITRRAAYLVDAVGMAPWQVLSITFTNKAAGEMRQRLGQLLSARKVSAMPVGTFHSLCVRLLREFHEAAGVPGDFAIFDTADQKRAMKDVLKEMDVSSDHFKPAAVLGTISNAKNELIDAEAYAAGASDFYARTVARIYGKYAETLQRCGALDFDDLLLVTARMLQEDDQVRGELQDRYAYIQIDEYQDTNHAQFVIAHCLGHQHGNLCAVGDPDQSIYGWRGANIRNILDFEKQYAAATVIHLGRNYRSTPQILKIADHLIRHNRDRRHKDLFTENPAGADVRLVCTGSEEDEAEQVIEFLRRHQEAGVAWGHMAVFYRINALSRVMEDALLRNSVPYQVARGTAFYQRKEIKDALAYLRVLANPSDEVSLLRIINTPPRGIGDTTVQHLRASAAAAGSNLNQVLTDPGRLDALGARARGSLGRFAGMLATWRGKIEGADVSQLGFVPAARDVVEMILRDSGLEAFYRDEKTGDEEKLANLHELVSAAQRFDEEYADEEAPLPRRLQDWLEQVSLVSDVDALDASTGAVTLMTLHAAKGLEFDVVAMIGLEDGLLPHARALDDPREMEEERRLCFVGITRARQHLLLTHARYRTIRGLRQRTVPSLFLKQMGREGLVEEDRSTLSPPWGGSGFDLETDAAGGEGAEGLGIGVRVLHARFGPG